LGGSNLQIGGFPEGFPPVAGSLIRKVSKLIDLSFLINT
jgi:hypothetical protein